MRFEPSGGLLQGSLVMQDKETDSYWSIMTGSSLAGSYSGTGLQELPLGVKTQWKDWVKAHPDTRILSVDGQEHVFSEGYDNYFNSEEGFRGLSATDKRLPTKAPVYTFHFDEQPYAVPFSAFEGGATFQIGEIRILLFRPADVAIFYSTHAFVTAGQGFEKRENGWHDVASGARFDPESGRFEAAEGGPQRLGGFDTFWYNWSLIHPGTTVLGLRK